MRKFATGASRWYFYYRLHTINKFEKYLRTHPQLNDLLDELDGKHVACWCTIDKKCHLDIFIKLLNERKQSTRLMDVVEL